MTNTLTAKTPAATAPTPTPEPSSRAAEWAARSVHEITLESGMRVKIRYPDLAILIEGDALPERLRVAAVQMMTEGPGSVLSAPDAEGKQAVDIEKARELAGLRRWLAAACLVDPKMSADELLTSGIPAEDIDLLASIAVRERNTDAVGVTLGVEPLSRWETFREAHRRHFGEPICGEGCPACEEVRGVFSTRRPMQV